MTGTIVDASGPVGGAIVTLGEAVADARDDGAYAFDVVAAGVVRLRVEHPTHATLERDLVLAPGETRAFNSER